MYISTSTFVTALLVAVAHEATAAPQQFSVQTVANPAANPNAPLPSAIPPEVLAAQQASASAAAAAAAAANSQAAAGGLRQPPGLDGVDAALVSLRPLPGFAGGADAAPVAPPVVAETTPAAAPVVTVAPTQPVLVTPPAQNTPVQNAPGGLRPPPGLDIAAPPALQPLPALTSVATSVAAVESVAPVAVAPPPVAPPVIGSFTRIVADNAAATTAETSAAAESTEATTPVVTETSVAEAPVVVGSFTPVVADTAAETSATVDVTETAATDVVAPTVAPSIESFSQIQLGTGITAPTPLAPLPTQGGFIFTNTSSAVNSGVAQATGGLAPLPGVAAPSGGLQQLPGVAAPSGGLQPLPGLNVSGSLAPLPGAEATATDGSSPSLRPLPGSPNTDTTGSLQPLPTGGVSPSETLEVDSVASTLTTMTTEVNGVATTLITAVALSTPGSAQTTGAGVAGSSSLSPGPTAGAERVMTSMVTALGGAVGVLVFLML